MASSTRTEHPDIKVTVSGVQLYDTEPIRLAHTEREDQCNEDVEKFDTNISNLKVKWEELGAGGRGRRKSDCQEEEF